ncbi:MAG: CheY-like chemotaxis protein [Rhodothermales bacterium]|jgi:CheY-like chemotaxis protein
MNKPARILVAEDNRMNLELVCYMLEKLNYEYGVAEDGAQAVEEFKNNAYSLILMDCHMAGMDGFQATKEIRRIESEATDSRRIPIVAVTANAILGDRKRCLKMDMDDYLSKPFKFQQLQDLLEKWLVTENHAAARSTKEQNVENVASESDAILVDLQSMGGVFNSPEMIEKLIQTYLSQAPIYMQDIRSATDSNDMDKMAFAAHALKSSSAFLGVHSVAKTCNELEKVRLGKEELSVQYLVSRLTSEFSAAVDALRNYES